MPSMQDLLASATSEKLELIINPTEKCNLRCVYCYEDFSIGRMRPAVIEGVLKLVERRVAAGLKALRVEFFGGEPFAAWPVVERLLVALHALCRDAGTEFWSVATTNGTLLDASKLDFLAEHGMRQLQITVDGPPEIHDRRRVTARGRGTYSRVIGILEAIKAAPARPLGALIRVHFSPDTVDALDRGGFVTTLARRFLVGDPRFKIFLFALGRWGGPNDGDIAVFDTWAESEAASARLAAAARASGCTPEQVVVDVPEICYAAKANAFVVRPDGRLSKCTLALKDPRNVVGVIGIDGFVTVDQAKLMPWIKGLVSGNLPELTCPMRRLDVSLQVDDNAAAT